MGEFLLLSIVASVVLTVIANIALRFWTPDPERWFPSDTDARRPSPPAPDDGGVGPDDGDGREYGGGTEGPRVRVLFPWRAMLVISIGLTVLLNTVALLTR
jgi:hypothetical protein